MPKKKEEKAGPKEELTEKPVEKKSIKALYFVERVVIEDSDEARELYNKSRYGSLLEDGKIQLSLLEAAYLLEKGKIEIFDLRNKKILSESFFKKAQKSEKNFWTRYCVFKDIRNKGYIIKTALKFGADFRVYDRGVKPGEDHAKWVVYPVHEKSILTWHDFSAKNRVAHSTRKKLLIGIVDEEADVTYYQISWIKP